MKPFLVRTRIPGLVTEEGAMQIFVAVASTEIQALHQVQLHTKEKRAIEEVIGVANQAVVDAVLNGMLIAGTVKAI